MVGLDGMADRPAPLLSGGQQQRVALARAVAKGAPVLLLDEPLSNLDANLREQMRSELRDLQRRIGVTAIYVTHDQEEALSLSDRIAVMRDGLIIEIDTPNRLYFSPQSVFTARFIGRAEVWPCRLVDRSVTTVRVETPLGLLHSQSFPADLAAGLCLAVRPEHIEIHRPEAGQSVNQPAANRIPGTVEQVMFAGKLVEYAVRVGNASVRVHRTSETVLEVGAAVHLQLPAERCMVINNPEPVSV
jgi:iron(III) transport system ATP-binding protein